MAASTDPDARPARSAFLLLGASNLRLLYPALARALLTAADGPARVHLACGVGRSYFLKAGVPWMKTAAVGASGALEAFLDESPGAPRAALVMDMGNDILYGLPDAAQVSPLATLVGRLARAGVPTVVVPPPSDPAGIGPRRYALVRALYYPRSTVPLASALSTLAIVRGALARLEGGRVRLISGLAPHLSPDRIHYAPWRFDAVCRILLAELCRAAGMAVPPVAPGAALAALLRTPHAPRRFWSFGREKKGAGAIGIAPGGEIRMY